jgi:hypothetical protein
LAGSLMFVKYPWRFSSSEFSSQKIMKPSVLWFWIFLKNWNRYLLKKESNYWTTIFLGTSKMPSSNCWPLGSTLRFTLKSPCLWALVWPRNSLHYLRVDWMKSEWKWVPFKGNWVSIDNI